MLRRIGSGRRRIGWRLSRGRAARIVVLAVVLAVWWVFWYTDVPLRLMGYPPTFVTVRSDPWPTVPVGLGHQKANSVVAPMGLALNVLLAPALVPALGILGAATGTACSQAAGDSIVLRTPPCNPLLKLLAGDNEPYPD